MDIDTKRKAGLILLLILLILTIPLAAMIGSKWIGAEVIFQVGKADPSPECNIFWQLRAPRVVAAFLVGAGLSVCGLVFQAIFRNSLASPFTLGVSSGAAFGASLSISMGLSLVVFGIPSNSICAFLGAGATILIVYGLTRIRASFSSATMLLAGVAMSFFFSSLIMLIQYFSDFSHSFQIVHWLMGSLDVVGWTPVLRLLTFVFGGTAVLAFYVHELNLLSIDEELAAGRGVEVARCKKALFFASSLTIGGVVACCGPIGFVGLVVPHVCRLIFGPDHRWLMPCSFLAGGVFLTWCDTAARSVIAPAEFPVGVLTAFLGGPFFIVILLTSPPRNS
ncbi:MAG: iron ABC transporter permease [Planctomycetes bacterium]|nr:iron ABC transporter permease [Planctomycetota bacterium]